jgi:hypothetical protein
MKSIEEIKIELTIKMLAGTLRRTDFVSLPKNDELRTFICSMGSPSARWFALEVDKRSCPETDEAIQKDPEQYRFYWIETECD